MPTPVSRTRMTTSLIDLLAGEPNLAAGIGVLGGVVQQVGQDLHQPRRIGFHR